MTVKVFWQPQSFNLDQIGQKRLVDISDGDTPNIRMNVRMLSIDTPETSKMQPSRRSKWRVTSRHWPVGSSRISHR